MDPRFYPQAQTPLFVTQLIDHANYEWNIRLVHTTFEPESAQAILSIPLPARAKPDKLIWSPNPKGNFLVHSSYRIASNQSNTPTNTEVWWKRLWKLRALEKIKMLMWRISVNALPTKDNMSKRIESIDPTCVLCSQEEETCCHLFLYRPVAKAIWFASWGFKPDSKYPNLWRHHQYSFGSP